MLCTLHQRRGRLVDALRQHEVAAAASWQVLPLLQPPGCKPHAASGGATATATLSAPTGLSLRPLRALQRLGNPQDLSAWEL